MQGRLLNQSTFPDIIKQLSEKIYAVENKIANLTSVINKAIQHEMVC